MKNKTSLIVTMLALAAALPASPKEPDAAGEVTDQDWVAVENCLAIIRQCQMADGMIRMKADGDPVWTVPYVSNFAAMALLAGNDIRPNSQDVHRVEQWLSWCADSQEPDGTINDRAGTVASYRSNGRRDSTDSYAATFLMAVHRYGLAVQGPPPPKIIQAARMALKAIADVTQPDGLTIAKPDHPMKYLMDNIEVFGGLTESAMFFESVGDSKVSQQARHTAARVATGLAGFWSQNDGCYAIALDMKGKYSVSMEKPYPHGLAQLFALAHVEPRRMELWQEVRKRFKPGDTGMPVERWLMAASRCASLREQQELRQATRAAMIQFTAKTVYVERPALAILALLDGKARFPDLPLSGNINGN